MPRDFKILKELIPWVISMPSSDLAMMEASCEGKTWYWEIGKDFKERVDSVVNKVKKKSMNLDLIMGIL